MTNEEAIKFGKNILLVADKSDDETAIEFTKLAIKALETIPKYKDAYGKGWDDGSKATYEHLKMCEEEQEPKYCDRNICISNEYNGISCNNCEVTKSQEKRGDLISRQAVIDIIHRFFTEEVDKIPTKETEDGEVLIMCKAQPLFAMNKTLCKRIKELPSVTAEPKTGHWRHYEGMLICSKCGSEFYDDIMEYCGDDFPKCCPDCGCRMVEPQESEGEE